MVSLSNCALATKFGKFGNFFKTVSGLRKGVQMVSNRYHLIFLAVHQLTIVVNLVRYLFFNGAWVENRSEYG